MSHCEWTVYPGQPVLATLTVTTQSSVTIGELDQIIDELRALRGEMVVARDQRSKD